jgi:hypothetical protein
MTDADYSIALGAYNDMARRGDRRLARSGRATLQGHAPKGEYVSKSIALNESDTEWLKKTTVPSFLERNLNSFHRIVDRCKGEAQDQEDILSQLTRGKKPLI